MAASAAGFDFHSLPERRGSWSLKWDRFAGRDVIPMWVADMDFRAPPVVLEALRARVDHGVFGYVEPGPELAETVAAAIGAAHGWHPHPDWFVWLPGLVSGLNLVARAVGGPGDGVLTGTPVYPPFLSAPVNAGRTCQRVPLAQGADGRWRYPDGALDGSADGRSRLFLLCNPHNPVGRVFTRPELEQLAEACLRRGLVMCADEIHCGLVLEPGLAHVPLASLDPEVAARSITLMAASKTFNLPGLGTAFALVPDPGLRRALQAAMRGVVHRPMGIGLWATLAAYRDGEPWRRALVEVLRANRDTVARRVGALPGFRVTPAEATYLAWIDARASGIERPAEFFEAAGVGLYDGADFGAPGFLRLNFGCPPALLDRALTRMERAVVARG